MTSCMCPHGGSSVVKSFQSIKAHKPALDIACNPVFLHESMPIVVFGTLHYTCGHYDNRIVAYGYEYEDIALKNCIS